MTDDNRLIFDGAVFLNYCDRCLAEALQAVRAGVAGLRVASGLVLVEVSLASFDEGAPGVFENAWDGLGRGCFVRYVRVGLLRGSQALKGARLHHLIEALSEREHRLDLLEELVLGLGDLKLCLRRAGPQCVDPFLEWRKLHPLLVGDGSQRFEFGKIRRCAEDLDLRIERPFAGVSWKKSSSRWIACIQSSSSSRRCVVGTAAEFLLPIVTRDRRERGPRMMNGESAASNVFTDHGRLVPRHPRNRRTPVITRAVAIKAAVDAGVSRCANERSL